HTTRIETLQPAALGDDTNIDGHGGNGRAEKSTSSAVIGWRRETANSLTADHSWAAPGDVQQASVLGVQAETLAHDALQQAGGQACQQGQAAAAVAQAQQARGFARLYGGQHTIRELVGGRGLVLGSGRP